MRNLLVILMIVFLFSCTDDVCDIPQFEVSNADIFYFPGNYDPLQSFPLLYYFDESFKDPNINYLRASNFNLLTETELKVGVVNYYNEINYIIAKKIAINYNDYGQWSDGIFNGLWKNTLVSYPKEFLLAINSETQEVVVEFLTTGKTLRRSYRSTYSETEDLIISIDTMTLSQGIEKWKIKKNFLSDDPHTGVTSLEMTDAGGNIHVYLNSLVIVDDKR